MNGPSDPQFGVHNFDRCTRGSPRSRRYCWDFGFCRSARIGNALARRESGGNLKDSIIRLLQGQNGEAGPVAQATEGEWQGPEP